MSDDESRKAAINNFIAGLTSDEKGDLLGRLVQEEIIQKNGWIPPGAWLSIQKAFILPYVEVLIMRFKEDLWEFFLVYRKDEHWDG